MAVIDENKDYRIEEILKEKLIPGVKSYGSIYNLITEPVKSKSLTKTGLSRRLRTDEFRLECRIIKRPWNKIGTYVVNGKDLKKFIDKHCSK